MLGGRRHPDRYWLRPLEASVASLPTFEIIGPEIALAAPLRGTGALRVSFFLGQLTNSPKFNVSVQMALGLSCPCRTLI